MHISFAITLDHFSPLAVTPAINTGMQFKHQDTVVSMNEDALVSSTHREYAPNTYTSIQELLTPS